MRIYIDAAFAFLNIVLELQVATCFGQDLDNYSVNFWTLKIIY